MKLWSRPWLTPHISVHFKKGVLWFNCNSYYMKKSAWKIGCGWTPWYLDYELNGSDPQTVWTNISSSSWRQSQLVDLIHHKVSGRQVHSLCQYTFLPTDLWVQLQDIYLCWSRTHLQLHLAVGSPRWVTCLASCYRQQGLSWWSSVDSSGSM